MKDEGEEDRMDDERKHNTSWRVYMVDGRSLFT